MVMTGSNIIPLGDRKFNVPPLVVRDYFEELINT